MQPPRVDWVVRVSGPGRAEIHDMVARGDGTVVAVGSCAGGARASGTGATVGVRDSGGDGGLLFVRIGPTGQVLEAVTHGVTGPAVARGIVVHPDDSCSLTGGFEGQSPLQPPGSREGIPARGGTDIFLARVGSNGRTTWVKTAGGPGSSEQGRAAALLPDGGVVITGTFGPDLGPGEATFGDGPGGATTLRTGVGPGFFVASYDTLGTLRWARRAANLWNMGGTAIASFPDGSCVAGGYFYFATRFSKAGGDVQTLRSVGELAIFLAWYDPEGGLRRVWQSRGPGGGMVGGIAALPDGSVVVAGSFHGEAVLERGRAPLITSTHPGEPISTLLSTRGAADGFVARFRQDGSTAWVRQLGGSGDDVAADVAVGDDGTVFVTGAFERTARLMDRGGQSLALDSRGHLDVLVAGYGAEDGRLFWATSLGGAGRDQGLAITADGRGGIVVSGIASRKSTLGDGTELPESGSSEGMDSFVARLLPPGRR